MPSVAGTRLAGDVELAGGDAVQVDGWQILGRQLVVDGRQRRLAGGAALLVRVAV
jgi:hypothetical protein